MQELEGIQEVRYEEQEESGGSGMIGVFNWN